MLWFFFFFFNDTATTEIYTLSLHDALPISAESEGVAYLLWTSAFEEHSDARELAERVLSALRRRSEEHTSELQSLAYLVCRLLLEKKKKTRPYDGPARQDEPRQGIFDCHFL